MQFLKCTKISLLSINFVFLVCVVILITDMNGTSEEGKGYEDNYMIYLYFTSISKSANLQGSVHPNNLFVFLISDRPKPAFLDYSRGLTPSRCSSLACRSTACMPPISCSIFTTTRNSTRPNWKRCASTSRTTCAQTVLWVSSTGFRKEGSVAASKPKTSTIPVRLVYLTAVV